MHKLSSLLRDETITKYLKQNTEFLTIISMGEPCILGTALCEQSMNLIL